MCSFRRDGFHERMWYCILLVAGLLVVLVFSPYVGLHHMWVFALRGSESIPSYGMIKKEGEKLGFGVIQFGWQEAYDPNIWNMIKLCKAKTISFDVHHGHPKPSIEQLIEIADIASSHGIEIMLFLADRNSPWMASNAEFESRIDSLGLEHLQGHEGIWGYNVVDEPTADQKEVTKYGLQYVKSKDPTHKVFANLYLYPETHPEMRQLIAEFEPYEDVISLSLFLVGSYIDGELGQYLPWLLDNVVIAAAEGKPVHIVGFGCWTETATKFGRTETFTEEQQAEYFRIYGEATKPRNIYVWICTLHDIAIHWGLFRNVDTPKLSAELVDGYLSLG